MIQIAANPSITIAELANQLEITARGIKWQISKLKKMDVLERIGSPGEAIGK